MSQTLTIPDDLYARLEDTARRRRMTIEGLLRAWQSSDQGDQDGGAEDAELSRRRAAVARMDATRADLAARYGEMPDSTDLIRVRRQCPFVTADERLVNAVASALPRVVWLGHWTPPASDQAATP